MSGALSLVKLRYKYYTPNLRESQENRHFTAFLFWHYQDIKVRRGVYGIQSRHMEIFNFD